MTIKNQPLAFNYPAPTLIGGFGFYYNIQVRPHSSSGDWTDVYHAWGDGYLVSTNTEYTITSLSIEGYGFEGSQTDIQVQAMIGQIGRGYNPNASQIDMYPYKFEGQTSSWSPTQTVTVPANTPLSPTPISSFSPTVTPTPAPNSTSTPNQTASASPKNPMSIYEILIATLVILIIAFAVVMAVLMRGKRR